MIWNGEGQRRLTAEQRSKSSPFLGKPALSSHVSLASDECAGLCALRLSRTQFHILRLKRTTTLSMGPSQLVSNYRSSSIQIPPFKASRVSIRILPSISTEPKICNAARKEGRGDLPARLPSCRWVPLPLLLLLLLLSPSRVTQAQPLLRPHGYPHTHSSNTHHKTSSTVWNQTTNRLRGVRGASFCS